MDRENETNESVPSDISGIAAAAVAVAPKPNEEVVQNLIEKEKETENESATNTGSSTSSDTGSSGNTNPNYGSTRSNTVGGFDPAIHCTNPDGSPKLTKSGKYRFRRGAKGSSASTGPSTDSGSGNESGPDFVNNCRNTAAMCTQLLFTVCSSTLGKHWNPDSAQERENLEGALAQYFVARGMPDMPPEVMLGLALFAYAFPRFQHPDTQERLVQMGLKKRKVVATQNASSDSGNDTKRQNSVFQTAGTTVSENGTQGIGVGSDSRSRVES